MSIKMVPTASVVVVRDGNRVKPAIGKVFEFTKEERDAIVAAQPNALRKPTDESADTGTASAPSSAEASQAAAKGGHKEATANVSDDEAAARDAAEAAKPAKGKGKAAKAADDDL